jgi:hypothetical protein
VQKSAQYSQGLKSRDSRTFARSDVMGNDEAALKGKDGNLHNALSTRMNDKWSSNVFAGPE